jgi:hypothetical protein
MEICNYSRSPCRRKKYQNKDIPSDSINEYELIKNMTPEFREYKLFLPLYDGVTQLEIGIDANFYVIECL